MTALVVRSVPGDHLARHLTAYLHTLTHHTAKAA